MIDVEVVSEDIQDSFIQMWYNCGNNFDFYCQSGFWGKTKLTGFNAEFGGSVLISVISASGNNVGEFDICIETYRNTEGGNVQDQLYVKSSTPAADANGNYLPGTKVEFCYDTNKYKQTKRNFLHGVVPEMGNAYDLSTVMPTVTLPQACREPNSMWVWHPKGYVLYDQFTVQGKYPGGTPMGAGWWFHSARQAPSGVTVLNMDLDTTLLRFYCNTRGGRNTIVG